MSIHSYSKVWIHLIWSTHKREKVISKNAALKLKSFIIEYCKSNSIYISIVYVNSDHVHCLIDLPTNFSIEEIVKLVKGASSHWINKERIIKTKFSWARGYGVFSVSQSNVDRVIEYIKNQEEHHKVKSFTEEYQSFIEKYGMKYFPG
jgi:REP element-mobilizing transposase RayT